MNLAQFSTARAFRTIVAFLPLRKESYKNLQQIHTFLRAHLGNHANQELFLLDFVLRQSGVILEDLARVNQLELRRGELGVLLFDDPLHLSHLPSNTL